MIIIIIIIILYSLGIITIGILFGVINFQKSNVQDESSDEISDEISLASQELIDYATFSENSIVSEEFTQDINILLQYSTTNLNTIYHSNDINSFNKEIICNFKNKGKIIDNAPNTRCYL